MALCVPEVSGYNSANQSTYIVQLLYFCLETPKSVLIREMSSFQGFGIEALSFLSVWNRGMMQVLEVILHVLVLCFHIPYLPSPPLFFLFSPLPSLPFSPPSTPHVLQLPPLPSSPSLLLTNEDISLIRTLFIPPLLSSFLSSPFPPLLASLHSTRRSAPSPPLFSLPPTYQGAPILSLVQEGQFGGGVGGWESPAREGAYVRSDLRHAHSSMCVSACSAHDNFSYVSCHNVLTYLNLTRHKENLT